MVKDEKDPWSGTFTVSGQEMLKWTWHAAWEFHVWCKIWCHVFATHARSGDWKTSARCRISNFRRDSRSPTTTGARSCASGISGHACRQAHMGGMHAACGHHVYRDEPSCATGVTTRQQYGYAWLYVILHCVAGRSPRGLMEACMRLGNLHTMPSTCMSSACKPATLHTPLYGTGEGCRIESYKHCGHIASFTAFEPHACSLFPAF